MQTQTTQLNKKIWKIISGERNVLTLKKACYHSKCGICGTKVDAKTGNKLHVYDKMLLFNQYGIIINNIKFRYCKKCVDVMFKILYGKKENNFISKYFIEKKDYNLSDLITQDVYLLLKKYTSAINKMDRFNENNYTSITRGEWYQMCSLDQEQFKEVIDFTMKRIKQKGI